MIPDHLRLGSWTLPQEVAMETAWWLLVVSLLWVVCYWLPRRRLWRFASPMPGPPCLPIVGNALILSGSMYKAFVNITKLIEDYGNVVRVWIANELFVILTDPDDIEKILANVNIKNRDRMIAVSVKYYLGEGLLTNRDEIWKTHRKLVTPLFHYKVIETYLNVFVKKSKILVERLEKVADGSAFDIGFYLNLCTLDAICETAIGVPSNTLDSGKNALSDAIHAGDKLAISRLSRPWLSIDWVYTLTEEGKKLRQIKEFLQEFAKKIVNKKIADYRSGIRQQGVKTASGKTITSFLDMMIESSETQNSLLSSEEICNEVITIAAAGLDTTSLIMSFFLIYVAIHPEVQDQIYKELEEVFQGEERMLALDDVPKLSVLDRALKETLRLMPAVGALPRDIDVDVELPSGYTIPKGSSVVVVPYMVHRNPKYYTQPKRFWPDRWLPEHRSEHARPHPYAYIPFSAGPRNCIGQKYALLQMKTFLSLVLRRFRVMTDYTMQDLDNLQLGVTLLLGKGEYLIKLVKRTHRP